MSKNNFEQSVLLKSELMTDIHTSKFCNINFYQSDLNLLVQWNFRICLHKVYAPSFHLSPHNKNRGKLHSLPEV